MSSKTQNQNGEEPALIAESIEMFYETFPQGRINTELVSRTNGEITFKASIYRSASDDVPSATGWAAERETSAEGATACVERTETSAIARALANLGVAAPRQRTATTRSEPAGRPQPAAPSPLGIGTRPPEPPTFPPRPDLPARAERPGAEVVAGHAAIADALALLETAERSGYSAERGQSVRQRLAAGEVPASSLLRVERALRRWLAEHDARPA